MIIYLLLSLICSLIGVGGLIWCCRKVFNFKSTEPKFPSYLQEWAKAEFQKRYLPHIKEDVYELKEIFTPIAHNPKIGNPCYIAFRRSSGKYYLTVDDKAAFRFDSLDKARELLAKFEKQTTSELINTRCNKILNTKTIEYK